MSRNFTSRSHLLYCCRTLILTGLLVANVAWATSYAFHIECPPDTSVDCDAELWDLDIYGTAYVYGYGSPQPAGDPISVEYDLNSCGSGTIVRTWVAYDYGNNAYYCSQTIYVGGGSTGVHIDWPPNYTIHECNPLTDPEDLPPPYDKPVVNDYGNSCSSQIMMGYEDMVFDLNPPACIKILRTWTVIDWCQYDPNDWNPSGIWEYTQIIKIVPENPPVIECPADLTVSAGADCSGTYVHIPPATGSSDCGADVTITNHSPYADSHGADASGYYPFGTTKIVFKASDGCGGQTTCSMYVTIMDMKAPTPVCYYGVSISLMQMDDGYYMDLRPEFFDKGSYDNCTPDNQLVFDIEPKRVDCSDIGQTPVQVFVTDLDGNTAWCNTVVFVQDNNGICPPVNGLIEGSVFTAQGLMLEDVDVALMQENQHTLTGDDGHYSFQSIPFWEQYEIKPERNTDHTEGITSMDLVVLLKHILGIERLESPYQYMAADLDASGHVSVNDLLALKDIVLRNYHELPTETSWRFVDAAFDFGNAENPLSLPIPDSYTISSFESDMKDLNFIGVKVGDLTGEAGTGAGLNGGPETRSNKIPMVAMYDRDVYRKGDKVVVDLAVDAEGIDLYALQYTLGFDPAKLRFVAARDLAQSSVEGANYNLNGAEEGLVSGLWFDVTPLNARSGLLRLEFEAMTNISSGEQLIQLEAKPTKGLAYLADGVETGIELRVEVGQFDTSANFDQFAVGTNYPNPFSSETILPVSLGDDAGISMMIFDATGRIVYQREYEASKGRNELVIRSDDLNGEGILICQLRVGDEVKTVRMLLLK